jgi:predicted transcriptional regulator YheO
MENSEFVSLWKSYEPFIQAVVELFNPFVEAAVHDLEKGKVIAIYHNISQRKVGDPSPLRELKVDIDQFPKYFPPYYKQNFDGRPLKCTSITLRNARGHPVGLICINVDVSFFQQGQELFQKFLSIHKEAENPIEIFGGSFEEKVSSMMKLYLEEHHLQLLRLKREQKKELVQYLYRKGVFHFKNAPSFLAKQLHTSRASIYNYIKEIV